MAATPRLLASAVVGGMLVVGISGIARAQVERAPVSPVARTASLASGSILGVVLDERGLPVAGAVVSALGTTTVTAVTDKAGKFELARLAPGPYHVRAHCAGFVASHPETIQVNTSGRSTSTLALRRVGAMTVLAAGFGVSPGANDGGDVEPTEAPESAEAQEPDTDDHGEVAWRLRHARRSVLKDVTIPDDLLAGGSNGGAFVPTDLLGRVASPARVATNFFAETAFSGQVNLLTTGSFDTPREFFSTDTLSKNIAYLRLGAPVGEQGDWSVRGAFNQSDISSWVVAGSYAARSDAGRHQYDLGLSYSTQRYDGGNVLALSEVTDGSRNAGGLYGYDSFAVSPTTTVSYGATYSHYDYLDSKGLISPRVEVTVTPAHKVRLRGALAQRALAPGAEEFLPPGDAGIWLPPQRTFSSLSPRRPFDAEQTRHVEGGVEGDFGSSTIGVRVFHQQVNDQLVTLFGADVPGQPASKLGHYLVGNVGNVDATGYVAEFRTVVGGRVHGSLAYSQANADMSATRNLRYLLLLAPSAIRSSERLNDLTATIDAEVPETATRILCVYRVGNGFAHANDTGPGMDTRFDVQVHQSLPFMNFSNARWEMLIAVRNFFREAGTEQSVYDELLVVRPPKRVVGGVTLRF